MIRNRLKELMAERGLKASRIANDIENLSRNTINSTVNNNGKMIQFETINLLCQYLGVTPNDFFEYLPFDVDVAVNADNKLIVNYPSSSGDVISGIIHPFYLNLYLKRISTNQASGITNKTFELSVVLKKPIKLETDSFNNLVPTNNADFIVVLGNPPIKKQYEEQKEEFSNFWYKELTPSFQQDIRKEITSKLSDYVVNEVIDQLSSVNWRTFKETINFRFDEVINDKLKISSGPIADFEEIDLPF